MAKIKISREEMKAQREAMRTPRTTQSKFYFLYCNTHLTRYMVFQNDVHANTEEEAREHFSKCYNAELLKLQKDKPFSKAEIKSAQKKLKAK